MCVGKICVMYIKYKLDIEKVPDEMLHDVYVDFEITQWGFGDTANLSCPDHPKYRPYKDWSANTALLLKIRIEDLTHEEEDLEDLTY